MQSNLLSTPVLGTIFIISFLLVGILTISFTSPFEEYWTVGLILVVISIIAAVILTALKIKNK